MLNTLNITNNMTVWLFPFKLTLLWFILKQDPYTLQLRECLLGITYSSLSIQMQKVNHTVSLLCDFLKSHQMTLLDITYLGWILCVYLMVSLKDASSFEHFKDHGIEHTWEALSSNFLPCILQISYYFWAFLYTLILTNFISEILYNIWTLL